MCACVSACVCVCVRVVECAHGCVYVRTRSYTHTRTLVGTHASTYTHTHKYVGLVLGTRDTTVSLNAIGSVLIYYAVYGYGWEVIFRGSIILAPVTLMRK